MVGRVERAGRGELGKYRQVGEDGVGEARGVGKTSQESTGVLSGCAGVNGQNWVVRYFLSAICILVLSRRNEDSRACERAAKVIIERAKETRQGSRE